MGKKIIVGVLIIFTFSFIVFTEKENIKASGATETYEEEYIEDGLVYYIYSDHAEVVRCLAGVDDIKIPTKVKNKNVTVIADEAFFLNSDLISIEIPNSIIKIGNYAFYRCENLKTITIPNSVTSIGAGAFYMCSRLGNIDLSENLKVIKDYTFSECNFLRTIIIPNGVVAIGDNAFFRCTGLKEVDLPSSLETIGTRTFFYDTLLSSIEIPESVISIGGLSFQSTPWLSKRTEEFVIVGDGVLLQYNGDSKVVKIPDNVKCISGFETDSFEMGLDYFELNMKTVEIPSSVTKIEDSAFFNAFHLEKIIIPSSVESIGDFAFQWTSLSTVEIPEGVKSIGKVAFEGNLNLTRIKIPDSVTYIGDGAFDNNYNLNYIYNSGSYAESYILDNALNIHDETQNNFQQEETYTNNTIQEDHTKVIVLSILAGLIALSIIGYFMYGLYKKKKSNL